MEFAGPTSAAQSARKDHQLPSVPRESAQSSTSASEYCPHICANADAGHTVADSFAGKPGVRGPPVPETRTGRAKGAPHTRYPCTLTHGYRDCGALREYRRVTLEGASPDGAVVAPTHARTPAEPGQSWCGVRASTAHPGQHSAVPRLGLPPRCIASIGWPDLGGLCRSAPWSRDARQSKSGASTHCNLSAGTA
eukprot:NODE_13777_length_1147_cov_5.200980.p1 GENE.NODE_13777_length_1147_cov_5.200980~~NODE_13777_length_1147_cov_5.200980.p1  ORF type:complete len:194 (+),score=17.07 NODE_13777_length_1147_cov_5.200980:290-871(+)